MLKQYKILVNEGKGSENVLVTVPAGAGERGNPTRITAKPDTRYELQDDLKGKGLGPDQVRGKRVGKNLYLMFEDNGKPDVIIEGYYDPVNLQQVPTIVGKAENGSVYEYIPHDPELSSMSTTLKDGYTPAMLSLGGGPIAGGAFELAGLPLVAAAAGGGLGGLGWIAAGLGAAALGGGGGGGGSGTTGPVAPNGGVAPTVKIVADNTPDDHFLKTDEYQKISSDKYLTVTATFDKDKVAVGDKVVFADVNNKATSKTVVLTQAMLDAATGTQVTVTNSDTFVVPTLQRAEVRVSALLQRDTLITPEGVDYTVLDTVSSPIDPTNPATTSAAPIVKILLDENNDHYVNKSELGNPVKSFDVKVTFAGKVYAKDIVKITASDGQLVADYVVTDADVAAGYVIKPFTFSKPAEDGKTWTVKAVIVDPAKNQSAEGSDYATLDVTPPSSTGITSKLSDASDGALIPGEGTVGIQTLTVTVTEPIEAGVSIEIIKLKDTKGVYWAVTKTNEQWNTTSLPVGEYTPEITLVDGAKNTTVTNGKSFIITDVIAIDDSASVTETGTVTITDLNKTSILDNDSDAFTKSSASLLVTKIGVGNSAPTQVVAGTGDTHVVGQYGDLYINNKGIFKYTATAASLTSTQHDIFTYSVVGPEGNVNIKNKTLDITINGVDQAAVVKMVDANGAVVSSGNQVGAGINSNPATGNPTSRIKITDNDLDQSYLLKSVNPNVTFDNLDDPNTPNILENQADYVGGFQGTFTLTLEAPSANDPTSHFYGWKYVQKSNTTVPAGNVTVHDLLTVTSVDGQTSETLDAYYANATVDTNVYQNFYAATTKGLSVKGVGSANSHPELIDTLILKGSGLVLDLTAASSTNVTEMERIDLTVSGNNTIKIDFASLTGMHSNQNQLYIIGDSGDRVQLVGSTADWGVSSTSIHSGYITYTHGTDQLLIDANITANNISFVAT